MTKELRMDSSPLALDFPAVAKREVIACFDGGDITSDAGLLLLAEADRRLGLIDAIAQAIGDRRRPDRVRHKLKTLLAERVFAVAQGYPDANDLDTMRRDPALLVACEKRPTAKGALASQPTISRLENAVGIKDLYRIGVALATQVVASLPDDTTHVILDLDGTDDECHGQQELALYDGHYGCVCYVPLHLHVTDEDGREHLLTSLLRTGNARSTKGMIGIVKRAVKLLRARFDDLDITVRGDCAHGFGAMTNWCDANRVGYVLGHQGREPVHRDSCLTRLAAAYLYMTEGICSPFYGETTHKGEGWHQARRIIYKVEANPKSVDCRYVVTSRKTESPEEVYTFYKGRGDQENRIKEMKLDLNSGRTSCHRFIANQFRLLIHTAACQLIVALQRAVSGTQYAAAQAGTLRLRLLKVGARVVESCRKIWLHLPTAFPDRYVWKEIICRLRRQPT
jgi:hypothetical protein